MEVTFVLVLLFLAGLLFWVFPCATEDMTVLKKESHNKRYFLVIKGKYTLYFYRVDQETFDSVILNEEVLVKLNFFGRLKDVVFHRYQ